MNSNYIFIQFIGLKFGTFKFSFFAIWIFVLLFLLFFSWLAHTSHFCRYGCSLYVLFDFPSMSDVGSDSKVNSFLLFIRTFLNKTSRKKINRKRSTDEITCPVLTSMPPYMSAIKTTKVVESDCTRNFARLLNLTYFDQ